MGRRSPHRSSNSPNLNYSTGSSRARPSLGRTPSRTPPSAAPAAATARESRLPLTPRRRLRLGMPALHAEAGAAEGAATAGSGAAGARGAATTTAARTSPSARRRKPPWRAISAEVSVRWLDLLPPFPSHGPEVLLPLRSSRLHIAQQRVEMIRRWVGGSENSISFPRCALNALPFALYTPYPGSISVCNEDADQATCSSTPFIPAVRLPAITSAFDDSALRTCETPCDRPTSDVRPPLVANVTFATAHALASFIGSPHHPSTSMRATERLHSTGRLGGTDGLVVSALPRFWGGTGPGIVR